MAKYKEVANEIRKRIKSRIYHSEEKIPDQESLAKEFGTSRVTIKKALDLLSVAGLVYTIQGSGTYVKKNAVNLAERSIQIGQNVGLTAAAGERLELKTEVLDFNVRFPDEEECNQLSITQEEPVYDIKRLRILDEKPYSLEHTIIPIVLAPNITKDILNRSLYDYLQGDLGIVFGDNRQTVRAVKPDDNDKQYLHCSNEDPVLEVSKVMFLERGTPLEYSVVHHRYDMVEMSFINVSRDGLLG